MNKKGFEMAISTIIIIVLAVLLLISLVVILNYQTGIFFDFIKNLGGKTNVDAIVSGCNILASQNSVYEFCCAKKTVKYEFNKETKKEELTCLELENKTFTGKRIEGIACNITC